MELFDILQIKDYQLFSLLIVFLFQLIGFLFVLPSVMPVIDNNIFEFIISRVVPFLIAFGTTSKLFFPLIQRSPYTLEIAGAAFEISLMKEMNDLIFTSKNTEKKTRSYTPIAEVISLKTSFLSTVVAATPNRKNETDLENKYAPKEKRKHQSSTSVCLLALKTNFRMVKLTWDNSEIQPLMGVIGEKSGKINIDFILPSGISRGWSSNSSVNASCRHHFFSEPQGNVPVELKRLTALGHVVQPTAHTGLIPIHQDSNFPDAAYKGKCFAAGLVGLLRIPFYLAAKSKPLEAIEGELPEELKKEVYYIFAPGAPKQTHR